MSQQMSAAETLYLQRSCAICGFYNGPFNGSWDLATEQAELHMFASAAAIKEEIGSFDVRSEKNISTLIPPAQRVARQFMIVASKFPLIVRIISGSRTYAEQDSLYAIGRTVEMHRSPVTNAKGGQSNHNFGVAWDVGIFDATGRYLNGSHAADEQAYSSLAATAKTHVAALEWGGDWKSFKDRPHYQLATGKSAAQVRSLFEAGELLTV
jgi:peptidoglycan L-alanyl-D-glutamate endopeptidase CwlK